jgi:hypothetical protein
MLIIFFGIKRIVHKDFFWKTKQSICHTIVTFYGNHLNMCDNSVLNFCALLTSIMATCENVPYPTLRY